jgi:hypothetical protein
MDDETEIKSTNLKQRIFNFGIISLLIALSGLSSCQNSRGKSLPLKCYDNQNDYSFMWWKKTIKTENQIFAIKTNNYSLAFDYENLAIQDLSINKSDTSEDKVLRETNAESFPGNIPCKLSFGLKSNGEMSWCKTTSGRDDDCQLIATGKYFQRRFITNLSDLKDCSAFDSGLEISSWPDRLAFILKVTPDRDLESLEMVTKLEFTENYSELIEYGDVKALKNPSDNSGFIILKSSDATSISITGTSVDVVLKKEGFTYAGKELNSGIIIYPVRANIDSKLIKIADLEEQPLQVIAEQIAPKEMPLKVVYDKDMGWHEVILRTDKSESDIPLVDANESDHEQRDEQNNRMERVLFSVTNPSKNDKVLRLNFAKGRLTPDGSSVAGITGISAVFRDLEGNPVGIPIQLSKNWHTGGFSGEEKYYFEGSWYHGLSMLTIPANTTISLEYTSVNAMWGGVPAASHAQLCLVGWGHNQQWDESAIGAWGETITYEPDLDQTGAPVLDFRPLLVNSPSGEKWGWTGNLGGADFFDYTKLDGNRGWHSRIRTDYKRYSPNFTEVKYAGTMDDNSMDFEYTASIGRSDDIARGIYKIKLKVLKDTEFKDFSIIEFASSRYHHVKSKNVVWGNETGVKKQWESTIGGRPRYITEKSPTDGKFIWFSFSDSKYTSKQLEKFKQAERGFVIRDWKSKINGVDHVSPWFAEYNTAGGNYGDQSSIIKIIPPKGCTSFKAGDYIEATIALIIIPSSIDDYYGPNKNFTSALKNNPLSWEMVYREAIGNDIDVEVSKGSLIRNYPITIKAKKSAAQFSVKGGLGYVPLIITNVLDYQNPKLFQKVKGKWEQINQEVHGNDFWQAEFDASTGTWDITYNLDLDSENDDRLNREFKFSTL